MSAADKQPGEGPLARLDRAVRRISPGRLALVVFLVALTLRLLNVWSLRGTDLVLLYMGDAESYHLWALDLAAGNWLGDEVFYQAPLYPYLLGVIYALFGPDPVAVRVAQGVMGAAACAFLALGAARLFGDRRIGLATGLLTAAFAPAIYFDGIIQKSSLDFFLAALLIWVLCEIAARELSMPPPDQRGPDPTARLWLAAGAVTALFALSRENALLVVPVLFLWIALRPVRPIPKRAVATALLVAGLAGALLPVAVRNYAVGDEFHLTTSQFGPNFYIGNNPRADGYPMPVREGRENPRFEQRDAVLIAEHGLGRELSPGEVSRYWTQRSLEWITSEPLDWTRLMFRKAFLSVNATEVADTEDFYSHAEHSPVLRATGLLSHFGLLAPLALLGIVVTWRDRRRLWPFLVLPAVYMASVVLFFAAARYRFPVVPFLALFAGAGIVRAPGWLSGISRGRAAACLGAVVAAAVLCNWPTLSADQLRATTRANLGAALEEQGETERAHRRYLEAVALDPESAKAHHFLGTFLQARSQTEQAEEHLRTAVRLNPGAPRMRLNLGVSLATRGNLEEALVHFREAVELDPLFREGHANLASALVSAGRIDEAFRHYDRAAELGQDLAPVMDHVLDAAWRRATGTDVPGTVDAEATVRMATEAVARLPEAGPRELRVLAAARAADGRHDEAVETAERALEAARGSPGPGAEALADSIGRELEVYRGGRSLLEVEEG